MVRLSRRAISAAPPPRTVRTGGRRDRSRRRRRSPEVLAQPGRVLRAGVVGEAGVLLGVLGGHAGGALAGGLVDAVVEVGLLGHRVGLAPGWVGQMQAVGAALVVEPRLVIGVVGPRLAGQGLQDDVQDEAAERLGLQVTRLHDALEEARELRGVAGEHPQLGGADLAEPDQVVAVLGQEGARGVGERRHVGEQGLELLLLGLQGPGGRDRVVEDLGDLGEYVGVGARDLRGEPQVLDQGGDLRVEPLEVAVDGLEVLAELLAATLESGGERVEGHVEVGRLHGAQQRVEVGEHLLDLGADHGPADHVVGLEVLRGRLLRDLERDVFLAEQGLRDDRAGDVLGDRVDLAGVDAEGELGALRRWSRTRAPRRR